ncbi:Internal alternative NAD(P)H-ubiquinone oxidoreductase [Quillaja saponaria]|uniref:Internal alternative NAD(P)H-ubiquinone oxidoreductase n=1 Tax=Quillaja saponaria TaxID=32244 RepID=A0AAD7L350_QUISA|nr:Internal alternative NAD(P)H-ubiquinone oxidoreductase [Quillaja saponaria]
MKGLDTKIYDLVRISPRNHMVFTQLLALRVLGPYMGTSATNDSYWVQKSEIATRGRQNKVISSQHLGSVSGSGGGKQYNDNGQSSWGPRRSESSLWLMLIAKL